MIDHIKAVLDDPYFTSENKSEFTVALVIADYARAEDGKAWPSISTLATRARVTDRGAQLACRALEKAGRLKIVAGGGRNGTNAYYITPRSEFTPEASSPRSQFGGEGEASSGEGRSQFTGGVNWEAKRGEASSPKPPISTIEPPLNHQYEPPPQKRTAKKATPPESANTPRERDTSEEWDGGVKFADWFRELLPKTIRTSTSWRGSWAKTYIDMIRLDGRTKEEIFKVCKWAREDSFWSSNFLTPSKLRKRNRDGAQYFDVFKVKMEAKPRSGSGAGNPRAALQRVDVKTENYDPSSTAHGFVDALSLRKPSIDDGTYRLPPGAGPKGLTLSNTPQS